MRDIVISKTIQALRKRNNMTQEQLAEALHVSTQAISKWETGTSLPDTQTLPNISEFFGVSLDYLFYGEHTVYEDIYDAVGNKIDPFPQMSKESYEEALKIFCYAHHGISKNNLKGKIPIRDAPIYISNENGVSLVSGKGYGAILTRSFFESIDIEAVELSLKISKILSDKSRLIICLAIISMSDISYMELKERTGLGDEDLRKALDILISEKIVVEKKSKHKVLGYTYTINNMYHTCLCILIATFEMQKMSLKGMSCCMGYGDFPIDIK